MRLSVVGATGAVGGEILSVLQQRSFPVDELVPIASARSVGRRLSFNGREWEVIALAPESFDGVDIALFDVPDDVSKQWAPIAAARGAVVVDNSAAFRLDATVPLVVAEINPHEAAERPDGIIASPNCTTLAAVVPLGALHARWGLRRLVLASYQAASGAGRPGIDELWEQVELAAEEPDAVLSGLGRDVLKAGAAFAHPLAMNVIPQCGSVKEDGYSSEELKLYQESKKILGIADLEVTATCVRVPVMIGHAVAVHATFSTEVDAEEARSVLREAPGVEVADDPAAGVYPTPLEAAGRDPCYVGRIRRDQFDPRALAMFCVTDNLRKGAALNTVQVAELLLG